MKKIYYLKEDSTPIIEDYELIVWFYFVEGHWHMSQALRDLFNYEYNQN
jgi:hypothetical protein